jgi:opacity protein-like surface antigen
MTASRVLGFGALALVVTVVPAAGQSADHRGFVRGLGGVTFVSETGGLVAGGAGVSIARHAAIIGEVGHFTNFLPKKIQTDLDAAAPGLGGQFGRPLTIDGKARGWYGLAGIRLSGNTNRVTPFAEAMIGRARASSVIIATGAGADVSSGVERALGLPRTETHNMFTLGGGLGIDAGHRVSLEFGYRYSRVQTDDPRINTGLVHAGVSFRF